jgi:cobyrinic acid a,c-diamide synthase
VSRRPRVLVVSGVASGVGKTTVTLGLLEAFRRRGLVVQAFKVGPDFIDPGLHALVTGRPSHTLDGWMCGRDHVVATVAARAADADLAVVEGVMGCFDGVAAGGEAGSTAEVAKWLGAPVVLVLDASAQTRSAAAIVLGFERFDPRLRLAGVVFNRVGGPGHACGLALAVRGTCRAEPLGGLGSDPMLELPERHLGLVTALEGALDAERRRRLADAVEASLDLARLIELAAPLDFAPPTTVPSDGATHGQVAGAAEPTPRRARIGVARDAAFQFYYPENLVRLEAAGATLRFWSPVAASGLPDVDGLYFGGGYPELHAAALAANATVRRAVRAFAAAGRPVYAECGGLMYLAEALEDAAGTVHPMVGVVPTTVRLRPPRLTLGYADVRFVRDSPLGPAGTRVRGHEFHASSIDPVPERVPRAWRVAARDGTERAEGYCIGQTLATYLHLHFGSSPEIPRAFVAACAAPRAAIPA